MSRSNVINLEDEKARRILRHEAEQAAERRARMPQAEAVEGLVYFRVDGRLVAAMTPGAADTFGRFVQLAAKVAREQGKDGAF